MGKVAAVIFALGLAILLAYSPALIDPPPQRNQAKPGPPKGFAYPFGDTANTGAIDAVGPRSAPKVLWRSKPLRAETGITVLDETLYVNDPNSLYAIDRINGQPIWQAPNPYGSQVLAGSETVYIRTGESRVRSFDAWSGGVNWTSDVSAGPENYLTLHEGQVFAAGDELYAIDGQTGKSIWANDLDGVPAFSSPAIGEGMVFATGAKGVGPSDLGHGNTDMASWEAKVFGFDISTGAQEWMHRTTGLVENLVYHRGRIFLTTYDGNVEALEARSGKLKWRSNPTGQTRPVRVRALATDGDVLYAGTQNAQFAQGTPSGLSQLIAIDPDSGRVLWRYVTADNLIKGIVLSSGVAYIAGFTPSEKKPSGNIYAVDLKSHKLLWKYSTGQSSVRPAVKDGVIYVGTSTGVVALK